MKANLKKVETRQDTQMMQTGALNTVLRAAKERIKVLEREGIEDATAASTPREHLLKMDLTREFHGKLSYDIEDFILDCNMYITARALEFKAISAVPLMALRGFENWPP